MREIKGNIPVFGNNKRVLRCSKPQEQSVNRLCGIPNQPRIRSRCGVAKLKGIVVPKEKPLNRD
jgi:hypothetical protein